MPEVQEVFRMATQKVRPDPEALERQFRHQRRRVAKRKVGVYAAVIGLAVAGVVIGISSQREREQPLIQPPVEDDGSAAQVRGLPPTVERLVGIWYEDPATGETPEPIMVQFTADGAFSLGAPLGDSTWISGTYEADGHRLTFSATGGACLGTGVSYVWEAGIVADGRLEGVLVGEDGETQLAVGSCLIAIGEPYNFTRVSPPSPAAADIITASFPGAPEGPLTREMDAADLDGLWLVEGTGQILRISFSGGYRLTDFDRLDNGPYDEGTVEVAPGTLSFVSGEGATECAGGDAMVLTDARVEDGKVRAHVSEDACARGLRGDISLAYLDILMP